MVFSRETSIKYPLFFQRNFDSQLFLFPVEPQLSFDFQFLLTTRDCGLVLLLQIFDWQLPIFRLPKIGVSYQILIVNS